MIPRGAQPPGRQEQHRGDRLDQHCGIANRAREADELMSRQARAAQQKGVRR